MSGPQVHPVDTPAGPARVHLWRPPRAHGVLALGHGAGPSLTTVDLVATREVAVELGWAVALVEQPWLVAGRKVATRPPVLDAAWQPLVAGLREPRGLLGRVRGPLVVSGRSAGARVACRTAVALGAFGVLALSFPLHPPGKPGSVRRDELARPLAAGVPVHVVQGERDPFGTPDEVRAAAASPLVSLYAVAGTHAIPASAVESVRQAVRQVLTELGG